MDGKIIHTSADGWTQTDVTEAVQALYDLAIGSMDFGSGFWTVEDAAPVEMLGRLCGFEGHEGVTRYRSERIHQEEAAAWWGDNGLVRPWEAAGAPHEHNIFSSVGQCMWPFCSVKQAEKS